MREEVLAEWNPWWSKPQEPNFIPRNTLELLEPWLSRKEICPIMGVRRSGKTTVMYMLIQELLTRVPSENILFVKCDDERVEEEGLIEDAREKHRELLNPRERVYLFLDEVQELPDWDKTVKRIYDLEGEKVKIFLTGSRLMKNELSSSLAGRFASFTVYPFSFREFLISRNSDPTSKIELLSRESEVRHHLREYLEWGGFPEIALMDDLGLRKELLGFYSDSILYRDVVKRSNLREVDKIEKLKRYLLANISNLQSYNRVAKHLGVSPDTVGSYVQVMEEANFIFPVPLFSFSLRKQQVNPKKIYCIDTGLRNAAGFRFSSDLGRLYENVVFLQLKRQGREIYYWQDGKGEVDFLLREGQDIVSAIQVCHDVEAAGKREIQGLLRAMEEFELEEGLIITGNTRKLEKAGSKRVKYVPLWEWLLKET